jgi:hypothetical protein
MFGRQAEKKQSSSLIKASRRLRANLLLGWLWHFCSKKQKNNSKIICLLIFLYLCSRIDVIILFVMMLKIK